ncbi:hypothetical protein RP20_CCG023638 [Aedes albopictus]|nr:hypothetical protein RP20_CCG023638 [Aedes albopictus]
MDETAVRTVPTKEEVFAQTGEKYVHTNNGNSDKESYTALFAANAAGTLAPPMVLFPYKQRLPAIIAQSAPSGWSIGRNQSGWMTQETFLDYLRRVFVPWIEKVKIPLPIIIFVDGHKSHVSYETIEFCRSNQITLVSLYPNATHVLQPLDVSFFKPLKVHWNRRLINYRTFHAGEPLPKHEIAPLLKKAVDDIKEMESVLKNGFRKCGIIPWDPNAVNYGMLLKGQKPNGEGNETVEQDENESHEITEAQRCLQYLESRLKVGQLKMFEKHQSEVTWPGPVSDTNLFYVWQEMKGTVRSNPQAEDPDEFHGFEKDDVEGE